MEGFGVYLKHGCPDKHWCWLTEKTNRTNLSVMNGFM